jgi:hypothetical protein
MAEFAYNNSVHSALGVLPFFAETSRNPRVDETARPEAECRLVLNTPAALDCVQKLLEYCNILTEKRREATAAQRRYASGWSKPHEFPVQDRVWLYTRNLNTERPSKKLDRKFVGLFLVKERIGSLAYRLDLSKSIRNIHDVFNVSLLEPYQTDSRSEPEQPPALQVEGKEEYEVEEILDSKRVRGKLVYLVKWVGYSHEENTWEPVEHLSRPDASRANFHRKHPDKPSPTNQGLVTKKRRLRQGAQQTNGQHQALVRTRSGSAVTAARF